MSRADLRDGACLALAPDVVDKYFLANANTERFQHLTAKAICGRCAVQATCLAEAIERPDATYGVRGGESARSIQRLHRQLRPGTRSALELARVAIRQQPLTPPVGESPVLRSGRFPDMPLLPCALRQAGRTD